MANVEQERKDIIQETLSLSKSGGIYFEGERVLIDNQHNFLFVGLGGTGVSALLRMKHQIYNRIKLPVDPNTGIPTADHPKNVAFLALDTDLTAESLVYGNAGFAENGSEVFNTGVEYMQSVLDTMATSRENEMPYAMWYPHPEICRITADPGSDGAGGKRPVGRAAFFNRASDIRSRIKKKLDELNIANSEAHSLRIFLFTGIAGGTGSGNYLDVAYMLKELGSPTTLVFGYVFLPDINESVNEANYLRYNGFSALKELDYFMEHGEESAHFFEQQYTATLKGTGSVPMHYCHLISATDIHGHKYKYDDVMKSVVESVFCYIVKSANSFSLRSHYSNVSALLLECQNKALHPAAHQYLSVGSASVQIPYMEITTLLAGRMFERMENTVFSNPVTKASLQEDMTTMGLAWEGDPERGDRMLQDTLRRALERNVRRPNLDDKRYDDIWKGANTAYNAAYNYIVRYQDAMNTDYALVLGEYEGQWRTYLKSAIRLQNKGPIYLANMVYSNENPCIVKMLRVCADYYQRISNTAAGNLKDAEKILNEKFSDGKHPGLFGKNGATKDYIEALENWIREEEAVYAYKFMSKLALDLSEMFEKYYKYILRDLKDTLLRVRGVFVENLQVLQKREQKAKKEPDSSILIYPFAFEEGYHANFEKCVESAYNGFLDNLSDNLKYWIGREIDDVDQTISGNLDIEGRLSNFISECFKPLYSTINMETILNSKKGPGENLDHYVQNLVRTLCATSYPMFHVGAVGADGTKDTVIISVPVGCQGIIDAANNFKATSPYGKNAEVRISDEKNRIEVVKIAVGFALYQNADIGGWEQAYEQTNEEALLHLNYGWKEYLPSPNVQTAWMNGYHCSRTEYENKKILENFDRCFKAGLISHEPTKKEAVLLCGNPDIVKNGIQLGGSLQDKIAQLYDLKQRIWNPSDPECKKFIINTCGTYLVNGTDEGIMGNIRANAVRDPKLRDALAEQCELLEIIREFEEKLSFPKYFSQILLCNLFKFDEIRRDISIKREESDPMPLLLLSYATDNYDMNASDFWYKLYLKVAAILTSEARPGVTWMDIVDKNWEIMVRTVSQVESKCVELLNACKTYGSWYYQSSEAFKREASMQVNVEKCKKLMNIADFYEHAYTEMLRIYNDYK